jgi:hypothetical protein
MLSVEINCAFRTNQCDSGDMGFSENRIIKLANEAEKGPVKLICPFGNRVVRVYLAQNGFLYYSCACGVNQELTPETGYI